MKDQDTPQARGGRARADALTPEQKKEIARMGAVARWERGTPRATHEGAFVLGDVVVSAAVLPTRQRLLTQATFLRALGRSRSPKGGTGVYSTVDGIPFFLQAEVLKPFITEDLLMSTAPVFFIDKSGKKSVGYDARVLPNVADVYLKYRDACAKEGKAVTPRYEPLIKACDAVVRHLAQVGIVAMVDKATGFQEDAALVAQTIELYVAKELRQWVRTFPRSFFQELCRLRGVTFRDDMKLPKYFGHIINDLVYNRLAPGVRQELNRRSPVQPTGGRRNKLHQWLTEGIGHPKLLHHLGLLEGMSRAFADGEYDTFHARIDQTMISYSKLPLWNQVEEIESAPEQPRLPPSTA